MQLDKLLSLGWILYLRR